MTMTDPIADMLTRLRNANIGHARRRDACPPPSSRRRWPRVLQREGYITDFSVAARHHGPGQPPDDHAQVLPRAGAHDLRHPADLQARPAGVPQGRGDPPGAGRARAWPSCRPTRGSCPTARRASVGWAARSSATCGEEGTMSRIGKTPIPVPVGRDRRHRGPDRHREGPQGHARPRGARAHHRPPGATVSWSWSAPTTSARSRSLHGLTRTLVNNMVVGVSDGFRKELEIVGVGYRATAQGADRVELALGFSHPVRVRPRRASPSRCRRPTAGQRGRHRPASWSARWRPTSASLRKPEPYKGKGVRYAGERVIRKAGKTGK